MESRAVPDDQPIFYIGQHKTGRTSSVSVSLLQKTQALGYDFMTTPITNPHFHSRVLSLLSSIPPGSPESHGYSLAVPPLTSVDSALLPGDNNSQTIGVCSPWIDLSSPDPLVASVSRQVLNMEIAYASFCGFSNVIVAGPEVHYDAAHADRLVQYARAIKDVLNTGMYISLCIHLPMIDHPENDLEEVNGSLVPLAREDYVGPLAFESTRRDSLLGTWDAWHTIRSVCTYSPRLYVGLRLPRHLPPMPIQKRWFAEPLRLLTFPSSIFLANQGGYPVLSKAHQSLLFLYMKLRFPPWIVMADIGGLEETNDAASNAAVVGAPNSPTPAESAALQPAPTGKKVFRDPAPHLTYVRHLQRNQPPRSHLELFSAGYQEYLQAPLQPLTENLESVTYEVFEKDPVKYEWYERAIAEALASWIKNDHLGSGLDSRIVVAVAGAGRGPLVRRALQAATATGARVEMWAVEKNPNAYVLLQRHNREEWNGSVTVVNSDMRSWKGPRRTADEADLAAHDDQSRANDTISFGKVDILISELLGSFGDNELSPECLDGAQHVLNPRHGISIPCDYTAHLTPIGAPRLHADVKARSETDPTAPETPYVVMLHAYTNLSTASASSAYEPILREAWCFSHPSRSLGSVEQGEGHGSSSEVNNQHNARFTRLQFPCALRGACDGLAGYFETTLWTGVELSTRPDRMQEKSPDMASWFPMFFPLKTPLYFPDDSTLEVNMWRQTDNKKVWYEWLVEVFANQAGKRVRLGCSELHSSRKGACHM